MTHNGRMGLIDRIFGSGGREVAGRDRSRDPGPGATTLPMRIYSQVRLGVTPEINAICTILIGLVASGVLAASIVSRRREQERQRAERLAAAMP